MDHDVTPIINDVMETIIINIECKKTVTINENYNTVFIIQSIDDEDYYNKRDIWWSSIDFFHIRLQFRDEVLDCIKNYKNNSNTKLSLRDALTLLYQP
jgi:hypothetical protein